jgi:small subunit ribosomal protein S17
MSTEKNKSFKRKLVGTVVSDKTAKTIVVNVTRRYKHPLYSKFVHDSKKYHAHDEQEVAKIGDTVQIIESKPFSKLKRWQLEKVL